MQKGSKNRDKQRIKVVGSHEKAANQRKDFLHKQPRQIANVYDCVYREYGYESNVPITEFWELRV